MKSIYGILHLVLEKSVETGSVLSDICWNLVGRDFMQHKAVDHNEEHVEFLSTEKTKIWQPTP